MTKKRATRETYLSQEKQREEIERALPLHRRIAQSIQEDITQRRLEAHTKIASEVELAKLYGVSHGTVTKALETLVREGILYRRRPQGTFVADGQAAHAPIGQDINHLYTSSALTRENQLKLAASQEAQGKPPFVGIVVPHLGTDFLDGIVLGAETMTRSFGYGLSFAYSEDDWALERYHIEQFLRQGVAGMIIYPGEHAVEERNGRFVSVMDDQGGRERIELLKELQRQGIPFVLIDRYVPEVACNYVVSDDFNAGYASTEHLIKLGHRRIGFVTVAYSLTSSGGRYVGYRQCLKEHGIEYDEGLVLRTLERAMPLQGDLGEGGGVEGEDGWRIEKYLRGSERPGGVVAMNDFVAVQIMRVAEEIGLEVPEDLAVVCSGGSHIGALLRVPLTCIVQPVREVGRRSAYIVLNLISGRFSGIRRVKLPVSLAVRESSGGGRSRIAEVVVGEGEAGDG